MYLAFILVETKNYMYLPSIFCEPVDDCPLASHIVPFLKKVKVEPSIDDSYTNMDQAEYKLDHLFIFLPTIIIHLFVIGIDRCVETFNHCVDSHVVCMIIKLVIFLVFNCEVAIFGVVICKVDVVNAEVTVGEAVLVDGNACDVFADHGRIFQEIFDDNDKSNEDRDGEQDDGKMTDQEVMSTIFRSEFAFQIVDKEYEG